MYSICKNHNFIVLFLATFLLVDGIYAQNKQTTTEDYSGTITGLSLKKNIQPESGKVRAEDIVWKRDIYRILDLTVDQNAPLYYPVEPSANRMNLFSLIFTAIAKSNVAAYEDKDGREVFKSQYTIKFKDLLIKHTIPFKEKTDPKRPGVAIFDIEASDIPSSEVNLFFIKEVMYLDQRNSSIQTKVTAICPVLVRADEMGETRRYPMFWIPFENLRTFLSEQSIAADSLNSAERLSLYDFFNQRRYKGELYMVSNLKNQLILEYCKTPEDIKAEQERLEKVLMGVDSTLWEPNQKDVIAAEAKLKKENLKNQELTKDKKSL